MKFVDLTGEKYGKLKVIKRAKNYKNKRVSWECICDCGNTKEVSSNLLRTGKTRSCGCLRTAENKSRVKHGLSNTKLYYVWKQIKSRCSNPKNMSYKNYGKRGITICSEWQHDFMIFKDWAFKNGYKEGLTIDRIDNEKGYFPENCRWVTRKEQNNNRRKAPIRERNLKGQFTGKIIKFANDRWGGTNEN